ncbi:PilZ domain-containing protein [Qipengyuania sp. 6B39]|nr:PilZ domain-containing protein [Qipengyuania proteolytica]
MDFTSGRVTATAEQTPDSGLEQRSAPRFTSLIRAAKLVCGQGEFVCVIRDVSASGVSLRTFHGLPTDADVALELQNGESYELEQVRANGFDASYRFQGKVDVERLISENWSFPKRQLRLNIMMPVRASTLTQRSNAFITNMSQQGARLECDNVFAIDQSIRIENDYMPEVRCKVRWRRDANYGLAFDNFFSLREFALLAARVQCPLLLQAE